jgi:ubiquinone/menaquinone biosynthesis C-methylase UbiE
MADIIIPDLENSQIRYRSVLESQVRQNVEWLDVGCGHDIVPEWVSGSRNWQLGIVKRVKLLVGIDADYPSLLRHGAIQHKVHGMIEPLPFKNGTFSLVTLNMVAEHLQNPLSAFNELSRVMEPNGYLIIHTPNKLSYRCLLAIMTPQWLKLKLIKFFEDRDGQDVFETYYRVNSERKIHSVAEKSGFRITELAYTETTPVASVLGPFVIPELLFLRLLRVHAFRKLRGDLIVILQKKVPRHDP